MSKLVFNAADVRRVVEHSINAPKQIEPVVDCVAGKLITKPVAAPAVILVHDEGVYLMSNGEPRDKLHPDKPTSYVAYAYRCNPKTDDDWYDNARMLVGGDDFGETLPWARDIKQAIDAGAEQVIVSMTAQDIRLAFKFPGKRQ